MDRQHIGDKAVTILGTGLGGALGLFGGPVGVIAGGMAGATVTEVVRDFAKRMLSNRESLRVDNASTYIAEGIIERLEAGNIVRQDGFFEGDTNFTSNGAELLEGILLKCKEQYQEKKVRLVSNLFKNVAFDASISQQTAYQTLSIAENLTYNKLCLLSYYGRKEEFIDFLIFNAATAYYPEIQSQAPIMLGIYELLELYNQGILSNIMDVTDTDVIVPGTMELTARGRMVYTLLDLHQIERADVMNALRPLEFQEQWGKSSQGIVNGYHPVVTRVRAIHPQ